MLVADVPRHLLARRLRREGVHLDTGAFTTHLTIAFTRLAYEFAEMYARYPLEDPPGVDDARVRVLPERGFLRFGRRLAQVTTDTDAMAPIPVERAFTAMETGLNWGVATSDVAPMIMHSAVLERDGRALIMPAPSGSGKSTLAAALALRGWRLLSDEMAVFSFDDGSLHPNPRPVSLKNRSVDVIARFEPRACLSRVYRGTLKGDVAYLHPPAESIARAKEPAFPGTVIAPLYREGAATAIAAIERVDAFRWLVDSTVNYASLLRPGFEMLTGVVERCGLYSLTYGHLDAAVDAIGRLHAGAPPGRDVC